MKWTYLQHTQENGHQSVAVQIGGLTLLEEDICFVKQHNAIPDAADE
jgi:hypothetical protein